MTCDPFTKSGLRFCRMHPAICLLPPLERGLKPDPLPGAQLLPAMGAGCLGGGQGAWRPLGLGEPPPTHPRGWLGGGNQVTGEPWAQGSVEGTACRGFTALDVTSAALPGSACRGRADSPPFSFPRPGRLGWRSYEGPRVIPAQACACLCGPTGPACSVFTVNSGRPDCRSILSPEGTSHDKELKGPSRVLVGIPLAI